MEQASSMMFVWVGLEMVGLCWSISGDCLNLLKPCLSTGYDSMAMAEMTKDRTRIGNGCRYLRTKTKHKSNIQLWLVHRHPPLTYILTYNVYHTQDIPSNTTSETF